MLPRDIAGDHEGLLIKRHLARKKRLGDCRILVAECEALREAILIAIQKVCRQMIFSWLLMLSMKDRTFKRYYKFSEKY